MTNIISTKSLESSDQPKRKRQHGKRYDGDVHNSKDGAPFARGASHFGDWPGLPPLDVDADGNEVRAEHMRVHRLYAALKDLDVPGIDAHMDKQSLLRCYAQRCRDAELRTHTHADPTDKAFLPKREAD